MNNNKTLTFEEIKELIIKEYSDYTSTERNVKEFAYNDGGEIEGLGTFTEVHHEGGEDQGSHWESVKHFPEIDVYISVVGWYQSHHGTDFYDGWDSLSQVRPKEKTIIVYE